MVSSALAVLILDLTLVTEIRYKRVYFGLILNTGNKSSFKLLALNLFDSKTLPLSNTTFQGPDIFSCISDVIMTALLVFSDWEFIY